MAKLPKYEVQSYKRNSASVRASSVADLSLQRTDIKRLVCVCVYV